MHEGGFDGRERSPYRRANVRIDRGNLRTLLIVTACLVGRPDPLALALSWGLVALGVALHVWSKGCLRQNRVLTIAGPYRHVRNPFYLANLLIDLGIVAASGLWWLAAPALPVWAWVYRRTILREEAHLESLFGESYRAYRAAVPRFLPRLRPACFPWSTGGFSWSNPNLARGSEYARGLRALYAPLLVWVACEVRQEGLRFLTDFYYLDLAAMSLLAGLRLLEAALRRRTKERRGLLPDAFHAPAIRLLLLACLAGTIVGVDAWETDLDRLTLASGTLGFALLFGAVAVRRVPPHAVHVFEALVCALAAWTAGLAWLGVLGATVFATLALDPGCACGRVRRRHVPAWASSLYAQVTLLLLLAVAAGEEIAEAGLLRLF